MRTSESNSGSSVRTGEPAPRGARLAVDEVEVVAYLAGSATTDGVMVDVGAHHGSALRHFLPRWQIYAFEPDAKNRDWLEQRYAGHPNVTLDPRALSDREGHSLPLYTSEVSTGISSLSPFHESHELTQHVPVTTLKAAGEAYGWGTVDVLKIDTEGYDLQVLRGAQLSELSPRFIVCEFENRKSVPLGYTHADLAEFLVAHGYEVWVSEWHPVIEYGRHHDWRRLARWPCVFDEEDAWGNYIALADPVAGFDSEFLSFVRARPDVPAIAEVVDTEGERGAPA